MVLLKIFCKLLIKHGGIADDEQTFNQSDIGAAHDVVHIGV